MTRLSAPVQLRLILPSMPRLDLSEEERLELLRLLRGIAGDHFPRSPRIRCLRQIQEKLKPSPRWSSCSRPRNRRPSRPMRR